MLRSQLLKGTLPLMILSVIGDGELYGYEIAQRIRERSGSRLAPGEGSLYPALHRLEREGALVGQWRAGSQGPRRRYYRVTPAGVALLEESRAEWAQVTGIVAAVAGSES
jgi:DNA-binding PadR family transcriptional regulator